MDINEYIRSKQRAGRPGGQSETKGEGEKLSPQEAFNRYSKLDETQLMQELFRVGSVSNGGVTGSELDAFYGNVQGYLTPEQAAKMKELIRQLKHN